MYRIIRKGELPVSRWSGGTTTQLAIWPEGAVYAERNFVWRVSSARVETQESEFTSLPGVARCLMVLDGTLHLEHEGRYETELVQFAQDNFSGSWTTRSRGRVTDFNLMTTAGEGRVQLLELGASSRREVELMPVVEAWRGRQRGVLSAGGRYSPCSARRYRTPGVGGRCAGGASGRARGGSCARNGEPSAAARPRRTCHRLSRLTAAGRPPLSINHYDQ